MTDKLQMTSEHAKLITQHMAAYHRMQAKTWGRELQAAYYPSLFNAPCRSAELTRLETYRPYGT